MKLKNDWDLTSHEIWIEDQKIGNLVNIIQSIDSELENLKIDFPYLEEHLVIVIAPQKLQMSDGTIVCQNGIVVFRIITKHYFFEIAFTKEFLEDAIVSEEYVARNIKEQIVKFSKQAKEKGLII